MSEMTLSLPVLDRIAAALEKIAAGMASSRPAAPAKADEEKPAAAPAKESPLQITSVNICPDCDAVLTPENSSRLASNKKLVHVGCPMVKTESPRKVLPAGTPEAPAAPVKALKAAPAAAKADPNPTAVEVPIADVRAAMVEFSKAHDRAELVAILTKFGAGKLAEVKPADYAALLEALRG